MRGGMSAPAIQQVFEHSARIAHVHRGQPVHQPHRGEQQAGPFERGQRAAPADSTSCWTTASAPRPPCGRGVPAQQSLAVGRRVEAVGPDPCPVPASASFGVQPDCSILARARPGEARTGRPLPVQTVCSVWRSASSGAVVMRDTTCNVSLRARAVTSSSARVSPLVPETVVPRGPKGGDAGAQAARVRVRRQHRRLAGRRMRNVRTGCFTCLRWQLPRSSRRSGRSDPAGRAGPRRITTSPGPASVAIRAAGSRPCRRCRTCRR